MLKTEDTAVLQYRGAIDPQKVIPLIKKGDYSFVREEKMGYYLSFTTDKLSFHAVDRFASLPLFYVIHDGRPIVSEFIENLLPLLQNVAFDPIGYYSMGGAFKGERSNRTPFKEVLRIPPGHYLVHKNGHTSLHCYWAFAHLKGKSFKGTYDEACEELGYLIRQGVRRCYEFAPNAALHLSGGMDSGCVAAIICQLSNRSRSAYAILDKDAPTLSDSYESGFLTKYQQHYPQLQIAHSYNFDVDRIEHALIPGASNWYCRSQRDIEIAFCQAAKAMGSQYILTGLGGDELASYGGRYQDVGYSIHNDAQAQLYMKWKIGRWRRWRSRVGALLKKGSNTMDTLKYIEITQLVADPTCWYTSSFRKMTAEWMDRPPISHFFYPSSYDYRLETLDRSYFSHRSDIWNFLGSVHDITYLHPLLDADLVNFCASLPRNFFRHQARRAMFKSALKDQLPADLLKGTKRPFYKKPFLEIAKIQQQVRVVQDRMSLCKDTFAATVYDYQKMSHLINKFDKQLKTLPSSHQQTLAGIQVRTNVVWYKQWRGDYLNTYFG